MGTKYVEKEFCPKCRKSLQAVICPACGGKRYHRQLLIGKRPCLRCKGAGREYQCYYQLSHDEDESRALKQRRVDEWISSYGQSTTY